MSQQPAAAATQPAQAPAPGGGPGLTTEQIQRMLEENYLYIKAIVDQQQLNRLEEMQTYTEKLQENLKVLAQMADNQYNQAQPQQGATQTQAPGQQAQGS